MYVNRNGKGTESWSRFEAQKHVFLVSRGHGRTLSVQFRCKLVHSEEHSLFYLYISTGIWGYVRDA